MGVCELLADVKVRSSISKALSNESVAEALQAILIASVHSPDSVGEVVASQMVHIAPVYFQLVSECPEILAAVPALSRLLCGKRFGRGRGCMKPKWGRCPAKMWRRQQQQQQQQQRQQQRRQQQRSDEQPKQTEIPEIISNFTDLISNASQKFFGPDVEMQKAIAASLYKEAQSFADNVGKTIEATVNATAEVSKAAVAAATPSTKPDDASRDPQKKMVPSKQLKAKYVKEADPKPLVVVPNEVFQHTWRIKNTGDATWPQGVLLKSVGGDDVKGSGTRVTLLELGPGETVDVPVTFTAPNEEGRFISYWRLSHNGQKFGDRMWVDMTVQKLAESSSDADSVDVPEEQPNRRKLDDLTDWVAVADAMRASGTSNSSPKNTEVDDIAQEDGKDDAVSASSAKASSSTTPASLKSKFSKELVLMTSMGFGNEEHVLNALQDQNGNIGEAVNLLLASQT